MPEGMTGPVARFRGESSRFLELLLRGYLCVAAAWRIAFLSSDDCRQDSSGLEGWPG